MATLGRIHSTDSFSTSDGPGVRFVVFMQGCLLRCQYCQNRDTWPQEGGTLVSPDQIIQEYWPYRHYAAQHGGITVSGGEPTLQAEFVRDLFILCREQGIHTCLDTNGFVRDHNPLMDELLAVTDLVLLDLKAMDEQLHCQLTGVSSRYSKAFARHLAAIDKPTWVRNVLVADMTATEQEARALGEFVQGMENIERLELLPYHELGVHKWQWLGQEYPLAGKSPPTEKSVRQLQHLLQSYHNNVVL